MKKPTIHNDLIIQQAYPAGHLQKPPAITFLHQIEPILLSFIERLAKEQAIMSLRFYDTGGNVVVAIIFAKACVNSPRDENPQKIEPPDHSSCNEKNPTHS